ncbi:hypothetical protein ACKWTF_016584 [Chironomus riparius]
MRSNCGFLLILLLTLITPNSAYKCRFVDEIHYKCKVYPDRFRNQERHLQNKGTDDVRQVWIDGNLNIISHLTESILPVCQRFQNLQELHIIDGIKSVDKNFIKNCRILKHFWIQGTEIAEIPENFFKENSKLVKLELQVNKLMALPENIFKNQAELQELNLYDNQINFFPPKLFHPLKKLRFLWLNKNQIQTLKPVWFENLHSLERLALNDNDISDLPRNMFNSLENLEFLWLDGNRLTTIHSDSFGIHQKFNEIDLKSNKIYGIDEKFIWHTTVKKILMGYGTVCCQEEVTERNQMNETLSECFRNYKPRLG